MVQFLELLPMTKKEKQIIFLYSLFLALIIISPYLYGVIITPQNKVFTWTIGGQYLDYNAYHAWVNQYAKGKIFAEILYTTESHPSLFFHPIFFLAGQINRFLKISPEIIFVIFGFLANLFLLLTLYYFISYFLKDFSSRLISFLFISLSSGLGWLVGKSSADLFLSEITFLNILHWPFIMSLGLGLLLWSLLFFIKSFEEKGLKGTISAGCLLFFLALIHPYDLVIFYTLAISYLLFFTKFWQNLLKIFTVFLFPLPIIVYYFLVKYSHFVWYWQSLTLMPSPPIISYLLGLAPFILFSFFSLKEILKKRRLQIIFIWVIVYFLLLYLPISFQWKLSLGISIPLGILAGMGLDNLRRYLDRKFSQIYPGLSLCFLVIVILFASLTNIFYLKNEIKIFQEKDFPSYLPKEIIESFNWLKENNFEDGAVFSSFEIGNFIPRYTGQKVFLGHWAQTIFAQEKKELVEKFFAGKINEEEIRQIFKNHQIKYIFYSDFEKKLGSPDLNKFGQEVFKNDKVSIFEVNL